MMKLFRRYLSLFFAVLILSQPYLITKASAADGDNPYPNEQTANGKTTVPCTYYAWQLVYDNFRIELPNWGNAVQWYANAKAEGYPIGDVPKYGAIAVYRDIGDVAFRGCGHVQFVAEVKSSDSYIVWDAGRSKYPKGINSTGELITCKVGGTIWGGTYQLLGFIYPREVAAIPQGVVVSAKRSFVTVSWTDVDNETSYDVYLLQNPWGWEDIKYSKSVPANTTSCTFEDVPPGYYCAFVIARPNANSAQSEWYSFNVVPCSYSHTAGNKYQDGTSLYATKQGANGEWNAFCKECDTAYNYMASKDTSCAGYYTTSASSELASAPYADAQNAYCEVAGKEYLVIASVTNAYGNKWYQLSNGSWVWANTMTYRRPYDPYTDIPPSTYLITNNASGLALDVYGSETSSTSNSNVQIYTKTGVASQQWRIASVGDHRHILSPVSNTSLVLNIYADKPVSGKNVNVYNNLSESSQQWYFEKIGNSYIIRSVYNKDLVLTSTGTTSKSNVYVDIYSGNSQQLWSLFGINCSSGHTWDSGTITKNATCQESGERLYRCRSCTATKTEPIAKSSHTPVTDPAIPATCISMGKTAGSHCSFCGTVLVAQTITNMLDHTWDSGVATNAPTCTNSGILTFTCSYCRIKSSSSIPALGHALTRHNAKEPSCTEVGWDAYETCSRCSYTTYQEIPAVHTPVTDPAVAPTVGKDGQTEGSRCERCGTVLTAQTVIPTWISAAACEDGTLTLHLSEHASGQLVLAAYCGGQMTQAYFPEPSVGICTLSVEAAASFTWKAFFLTDGCAPAQYAYELSL